LWAAEPGGNRVWTPAYGTILTAPFLFPLRGGRDDQAAGKYLSLWNIALVNELKLLCRGWNRYLGGDCSGFHQAVGFQPFYPGRACGHCIPIDPFYLSWKPRNTISTRASLISGEIN